MTDDELRDYIRRGRKVAGAAGTMHAQWDTIFDAEAILAGEKSLLDRETVERMLRVWLDGRDT